MSRIQKPLWEFLFPVDSGLWLCFLRKGLGLQLIFHAVSLREDWNYFFVSRTHHVVVRDLHEAILSAESILTPRLGWLTRIGDPLGLSEPTVLWLVWFSLLLSGLFLVIGFGSRVAAVAGWLLYLACTKSSAFLVYGVDNFTTIGLFYLAISPLPDRWTIDHKLRPKQTLKSYRLGFHRRVLQIHLCIIYFFAGISKSLGPDWWNGNSIWRALTRPPFDVVNPDLLIRFDFLFPAAGILVCLLETAYPAFIWLKSTRAIWLGAILLMHLSIGVLMGLYLFALIMLVLNLAAFGPGLTWPVLSLRRWPFRRHSVLTEQTRQETWPGK